MRRACVAMTLLLGATWPARLMAQGLDFGSIDNFREMRHWQHGSVYYIGKVATPAGVLQWDPIPIVVNCNGIIRMNTETDQRRQFRLESSPTQSEVGVSETSPQRIDASSLAGCKVQADVPGFESSTLNIINNSIMDDPNIGTITLKPDEKILGAAISATTEEAPAAVQKEFVQARSEFFSNHQDVAERLLQQMTIADPKFAEAWYQLGRLQEKARPQDALHSFNSAVAADPDFISPYVHIAAMQALQENWEASLMAVRQSLKLNPSGSPWLWYLSALANLHLNQPRFAEASARTSLAMDPSHLVLNTEQLLAVVLARRGDYSEAILHLRNSLSYMPPGPDTAVIKKQIAEIEKAQASAVTHGFDSH